MREMAANNAIAGKWVKNGLAALGAAAVALPLASAVATPVDPTQVIAEEDPSTEQDPASTEKDTANAELEHASEEQEALSAEQVAEARDLFNSWSCGACHVLTDANAHGHIGPSLDGNNAMDKAFIVARVTNGQGAMPGFGGQMSDEEIELVSAYIMEAKK